MATHAIFRPADETVLITRDGHALAIPVRDALPLAMDLVRAAATPAIAAAMAAGGASVTITLTLAAEDTPRAANDATGPNRTGDPI